MRVMARLVLINGAPGSGKSTLAQALAEDRDMALALDIDAIKHSLEGWQEDPAASGVRARRLALAMARDHLTAGHDLVVGQYLARTDFIESLTDLAESVGATFHEFVLELDESTLHERLAQRRASPTRPEHEVNNKLVGPDGSAQLLQSLNSLRRSRPDAVGVNASGSPASALTLVRDLLH